MNRRSKRATVSIAAEIEAQRNNPDLMAFLDEEGRQPQRTLSLAETKAMLGLP